MGGLVGGDQSLVGTEMRNNKRTIRQMGLSRHMIPEHEVLLNIIRLNMKGRTE